MLPIQAPKNDPRPLPLIVAAKWQFELAYINRDGNPDHYLYAVQDWIVGLSGSSKGYAQKLWSELNPYLQSKSSKLPYKASNGRTYQMDFTEAHGLYLIAQEMRALAKRPQLQEIKNYLSDAGVFTDIARRKPDEVAEMLSPRERGIEARKEFTSAAKETHVRHLPFFGVLTDVEYQILLGAAKQVIVERLQLTDTQAKHFRDHLGNLALQALEFAESAAATKMKQQGRALTHEQQLDIVRTCAQMVAPSYRQLVTYLGLDRIQNRPLLNPKKD